MSDAVQLPDIATFSEDELREINTIKSGIDLTDADYIGRFGNAADTGDERASAFSQLIIASPVSGLAKVLGEIAAKLEEADPKRVAKKPGRLKKFTGAAIEERVRYALARKKLEELRHDARAYADQVQVLTKTIDELAAGHQCETQRLRLHGAAGRLYLCEHPDAGLPGADMFAADNARERFTRRLANMAILLASHEMELTQFRLARAQAVSMLDRYYEMNTVVVRLWHSNSLAVANASNSNAELIASAVEAHETTMEKFSEG